MRPALYLRVSRADQADSFSLDAQERALRAYCAAQGWDEPQVYIEPGHSAHAEKANRRPVWLRLMADAAAGAFDVVVVHKLDRWSRSVPTALASLADLDKHGVGFVSLGENMNFTGPWGRAMFGILAIFAQLYSDNLSTEAKKGLQQRALAGFLPPSIPYGARLVDDGKALAVDPDKADALARILQLASTRSYEAAAQILNAEGVPSRRGGPWWDASVAKVVAAAGWLATQPPPWPERYHTALARVPRPPVRADQTVRMLTGLMRCGHCGGSVVYNPHRQKQLLNVRCNRKPQGAPHCLPGAPRKKNAAHYEEQVEAWVASLPPRQALRRAADRLAGQADPARNERLAIARAKERVRKAFYDERSGMGDDEYETQMAALDERERALPALPQSARALHQLVASVATFPALSPEARRDMLVSLLREVVITGTEVACVPSEALARLLAEEARVRVAA